MRSVPGGDRGRRDRIPEDDGGKHKARGEILFPPLGSMVSLLFGGP